MNDQELLTAAEAAKLLRRSNKTLWNWRRVGTGPKFIVLPLRGIRYRRSAIEEWLDSHTEGEQQ